MKREEAINCLKVLGGTRLLDEYDDPVDFDPYEEAIDMAIEALKAEPNGDLISRADAIEAVKEFVEKINDEFGFRGLHVDDAIKILSTLPSADVVSREDYHNLLMASEDIDRALRQYQAKEEADAVTIHKDGTLNIKVPNARNVGRVLVMDTDSHIGGGLFYPESADAVHGEWTYLSGSKGSYMTISCPICGSTFDDVAEWQYNYCPNCGAKMDGERSE